MHREKDSFLLEKLKGGDREAFDAFFVKYYKLLVANAYFYLKDEQEAKDLVQDFMFDFWHKQLFLRLDGDMKGYLYRSIQHRCFNVQRKKAFEEQEHVFLGREVIDFDESTHGHEQDLIRLQDAMEGLPVQRKEVIQRVYFEEKKYQDAADEMGISLNTFKTHLKFALKNLREKLKKN